MAVADPRFTTAGFRWEKAADFQSSLVVYPMTPILHICRQWVRSIIRFCDLNVWLKVIRNGNRFLLYEQTSRFSLNQLMLRRVV
jgi:hypothetical protein